MNLVAYKKGSSLLLVLLILTGFSGILFAISQQVRGARRQSAGQQFAHEAELQAMAGIDEGIMRMKTGALDARGEYGTLASTTNYYRLSPIVRGFKSVTTSCDTPTDTGLDLSCPYYTIAVRRMVGANVPGESLLRASDIPAGGAVSFGYFSSQLPPKQRLSLQAGSSLICSAGCSGDNGFTESLQSFAAPTDFFTGLNAYSIAPAVPNAARGTLTLQLSGAVDDLALSLAPDATAGQAISQLYQRPDAYIVSTGYSGTTRHTIIAKMAGANPSATPQIIDFTGEVGSKGYIYQ